jgi:hypothetical protein
MRRNSFEEALMSDQAHEMKSSGGVGGPITKRFSLDDLVVLLVGNGVGLSLSVAAGDAAVNEHWRPMFIGLPLMAVASLFPFWKNRAATWLRDGTVKVASYGIWVAILLGIMYVLGPYLIASRSERPSANEIAAAIAPLLPKPQFTQGSESRQASTDEIAKATAGIRAEKDTVVSQLAAAVKERDELKAQVNSLQAQSSAPPKTPILGLDDEKRWQLVKAIEDLDVYQSNRIKCPAIHSIDSQNKLAGQLFEEFYPMIYYSWGAMEQGFQPPPHQPFGITLLTGTDTGIPFACASHLAGLLQNVLPVPVSLKVNQVSDNLAKCHNACVEIRYGGER